MNESEMTTEQKLSDISGKCSQLAYVVLFFREVLPKEQGDAILRLALESWERLSSNPEPPTLPDNWVVYEGEK